VCTCVGADCAYTDTSRKLQSLTEFEDQGKVDQAEKDEGGSGTSGAVKVFIGGIVGLVVMLALV
jgi:hypothetical protein